MKHLLCCSQQHSPNTEVEATKVLRIDFVFSKKGFRPLHTTSYYEIYVCDNCATEDNAAFFHNDDMKALGAGIAATLSGTLNWKETTVKWDDAEKGIKYFEQVNIFLEAQQKQQAENRASQLLDAPAANSPTFSS